MTAYIWKGHGADHTGNWQTTTDWTPTGEPGAGDSATINNGTATEDINESFGSSLSIAALKVGPNGHLVIGDSAGADDATLDITGSAEDDNLGSITIYGGSELIAAADLKLGSATATGVLNFDGGTFSDGSLFINGEGVISMQAGALGSVSTNKGTIDATNPNSGFDYFTLSGGTLNNFGTLEATNSVSGSSGVADLFLTGGISVTNKAGSAFGAGSGAVVTLSDATVTSGTFTGQMDAVGVNDTIKGTNSLNFVNEGTISVVDNGSLTIAGGSDTVINKSQIDVNQGTLKLTGTIDNELNAEIVANGTEGTKAIVTSGSGGAILNNGALIADAGKMTFNNEVIGGQETIEDDELMTFNYSESGEITFTNGGGTLGIGNGPSGGGNGPIGGDISGFASGDILDFTKIVYVSSTDPSGSYTQSNAAEGLLTVGSDVLTLLGNYAPVGDTQPLNQGPFVSFSDGHGGTDVIYSPS